MTTTRTAPRTLDRLAIRDARTIATTWDTTITKDDTDGEGRVQLVLSTHHDSDRRLLRTTIHTHTLTPSGFLTRNFVLYGPASTDGGLTVSTLGIQRFNQRVAREFHAKALDNIETVIENIAATKGTVGAAFTDIWAARA